MSWENRRFGGLLISALIARLEGELSPISCGSELWGTLKKGDVVTCGGEFGKMHIMFDDRGGRVDEVGPSMAVRVIGLSDVPVAGDELEVVDSLDIARERADTRAESLLDERISAKTGQGKVTLSSIASSVSAGKQYGLDMHQLNVILKVDVQGSIEAIKHALQALPQENVTLKFVHQAPGDVTASDVDLIPIGAAEVRAAFCSGSGSVGGAWSLKEK